MKKNIIIALAILIVGGGYLGLYYREQQSIRFSECRKEAKNVVDKRSGSFLAKVSMGKDDNCYAYFNFTKDDFKGSFIENITNAEIIAGFVDGNEANDISNCGLNSKIEKYKIYDFKKHFEIINNHCRLNDEGKNIIKDTWKELTGEEL